MRLNPETENMVARTAPNPEPLLLTADDAARASALSPRKLWSLTVGGEIPCVRIGRAVRYDRADLLAWIEACKTGK